MIKFIRFVAVALFATALSLVGCNKDSALNQNEIGKTEEKLAADAPATHGRFCATYEHNAKLMAEDAQFRENQRNIEEFTTRFVAENGSKTRAVVTIPVVVHVVYNTTAQNISDAMIKSQIAVLNEDFRKLNTDVSKVPSAFAPLAADCEIQFCLAAKTPTGAATTGIERRQTTRTSFSTNDFVKRTSQGGLNAWDATKYLNIWVCNLSQSLLGYAQFPGGSAATDGVVILFSAFGRVSTAANYDLGRTTTHEVGHWLNLRHIWGDATCGNDLVADTPTQQTSNGGCPVFPKVTCGNGPNGDMFMNYMDYTYDRCMYMFTAGQKSRMQAALNGTRASLLTASATVGCAP